MKVYLDVVIIINFLFDYFLLSSINYILRRNIKQKRLILGSLFGSITIFLLFIKINIYVTIIYRFITSLIMILLTFGYKDFQYTKKNIIYFYLVSMLLGGAIYYLKNQFTYTNNGLVFNKHPLKISYIVIITIGLFIYTKYMKYFKELKTNYNNYYKCEIYIQNNHLYLTAFLDTGNKLKDPYGNKNIILLDKNKLLNIEIPKPLYIPYNSLNNHGLLKCFKAEKIIIDGKENKNFLIGISDENFFIDGIDCIINSNIMEELK